MRNIWKTSVAFFASLALATSVAVQPALAQMTSVGGYAFTSFHSDITVNADASVDVVERIEGEFYESRHGIYRKIPVRYQTDGNKAMTIPLQVTSVLLNGKPEPFDAYREGGDLVIKIGAADVTFAGPFAYQISYSVDRVMLYEDKTDQLYWNVTGDGWDVPITDASATITLPPGTTGIQAVCFNGVGGSTKQDCQAVVTGNTVEVSARDFLTAAVRFPKGVVSVPTAWKRFVWALSDSWGVFFWILPFLVAFGLYHYWRRHGKDEKGRGIVIPEYDPPVDMRPAEAGTIIDTKADDRDIAATFVDLAVRGYLQIIETEEKTFGLFTSKSYTLKKQKGPDGLKPFEREIFDEAFASGEEKILKSVDSGMAGALSSAKDMVYASLSANGYFKKNPKTVTAVFVAIGLGGGFAAWIGGIAISAMADSLHPLAALMVSAALFFVAAPFMKAYTAKGAEAKEQVQGFKLFLTTAERYRLQWQEREGIFEKFLPYAMAFGVTDKWAKAFEGMNLPQPTWFVGAHAGLFVPTSFANSVSSFGTIASSVSAPSSRSGGGFGSGGSSGGGFGGGGGGSW